MMRFAVVLSIAVAAIGCAAAQRLQRTEYADGNPREEYELHNGERHGSARGWHANGTLAWQGSYVAGKREGKFLFFAETGTFEHQAIFHRDEEIWRSTNRDERPDMQALAATRQRRIKAMPTPASALPVPWFSIIDRTTSLDRAGVQFGLGGPAGLTFGSARRFEVFANYTRGELGGYAQLSQTSLDSMSGRTLWGRRTLEAGATHRVPFDWFDTTANARLGILVPVGNDTTDGFIAGTAGAFQRPSDAASSMPSTIAVRSGANLTRIGRRLVLQADLGIDWLMGGVPSAFDALARANVGVGFGSRSRLIGLEVANTISLTDLERRLHGVGLSGGVRVLGVWVSGVLSYCVSGDAAFTTGVGYEL